MQPPVAMNVSLLDELISGNGYISRIVIKGYVFRRSYCSRPTDSFDEHIMRIPYHFFVQGSPIICSFVRTSMILDTDFARLQLCSNAQESYQTWKSDPSGATSDFNATPTI